MIMGPAVRRRYQFSVRSLLVVTAILALLLVPVVWVTRERQQMLRARNEALRAVILAERYRLEKARQAAIPTNLGPAEGRGDEPRSSAQPAGASAWIERLERENAELKDTIEQLRREVERLKARPHD